MVNVDIKYFLIVFTLLIFFLYGLILSEIIDFIFPDYDDQIHDYRTAIEMIVEISIAYIIYYTFKHYYENIINLIFSRFKIKIPFYLNDALLISFSFGIFKHLQKSNNKMKHFKDKVINHVKEKLGFT